jgi:hypothetical protein
MGVVGTRVDGILHDENFLTANFFLKVDSVSGTRFHQCMRGESTVSLLSQKGIRYTFLRERGVPSELCGKSETRKWEG